MSRLISLALLAATSQAQGWREQVADLVHDAYRRSAMEVGVRAESLTASRAMSDVGRLRVREVRSDRLHRTSLIVLAAESGHPVAVTSSELLPELRESNPEPVTRRRALLVHAGERKRWTVRDGAVTMQLDGVALASAREGEVLRLRLEAEGQRVVKLRLLGQSEAEVVP